MLILFVIQSLSFLFLLAFIKVFSFKNSIDFSSSIKILREGQQDLENFMLKKDFLLQLVYQAKKKGLAFNNVEAFLQKFLFMIQNFGQKNQQLYTLFVFRLLITTASGFILCFFVYGISDSLSVNNIVIQQVLCNAAVILLYVFILSLLKRAMIQSFFYHDSYTLVAQNFLKTYLLDQVSSESPCAEKLLKMRQESLRSGLSTIKERNLLLENWVMQEHRADRINQEKFEELIPIYELLVNSIALCLLLLPVLSKVFYLI